MTFSVDLGTSADRHPKWVRVEPGHVVPAGQPYRKERKDELAWHYPQTAEYLGKPFDWTLKDAADGRFEVFVDSSWIPPLNLPTEPTWGIAVERAGAVSEVARIGRWWRDDTYSDDGKPRFRSNVALDGRVTFVDRILDFIPLTEEQVARIEGAR